MKTLHLLAFAFLAAGCASDPPPANPQVIYVQHCTGCGAEWQTESKPGKPITDCPLCPMSVEEFEKLQEALRLFGGER